jgi:hypothetical protein
VEGRKGLLRSRGKIDENSEGRFDESPSATEEKKGERKVQSTM